MFVEIAYEDSIASEQVWKNRDHDQMGETCLAVNSFGWKRREIVSLPQQLAQEPVAKLNCAQILQDQTQIGQ